MLQNPNMAFAGFRASLISRRLGAAIIAAALTATLGGFSDTAHAREAYAKRTKQLCTACHTRGHPLTALGRAYRANNYKLPKKQPPCREITFRLYDKRGVFRRYYTGCFPIDGPEVKFGQ